MRWFALFNSLVLIIAATVGMCFPGATLAADEWVKYESTGGKFTVLFPGKPTELPQKLPSGEKIFTAQWSARGSSSALFASYDNYAANSPERYLEGVRRGMQSRGQLDKAATLKIGGLPAGDFAFHRKQGDATLYYRKLMIVDKDHVYQLMAGSTKAKPDEALVKKFFESFQLVK